MPGSAPGEILGVLLGNISEYTEPPSQPGLEALAWPGNDLISAPARPGLARPITNMTLNRFMDAWMHAWMHA